MYLRTYEHDGRCGYLFGTEGFSGPLAAVDPAGDLEALFAERRERPITHVFLTSGRFDAEALRALVEKTGAGVYAHRAHGAALEGCGIEPRVRLCGGDRFDVGGIEVRVLATPGVDRGAIALLAGQTWLFTGETLPLGPRADDAAPSEDPTSHYVSLRMLAQLPPETIILPGRRTIPERRSTLGRERTRNPYFTAPNLERFRMLVADKPG